MGARALWRAAVCFGDVRVPVKFYAAVEDRSVHFRLLHATDKAPVRQALFDPVREKVVPWQAARRAWPTGEGGLVMLDDAELDALHPTASREVRIERFVPPSAIDHRWYVRPYYLGPDDGAEGDWIALAAAMAASGREGLARWTMRDKDYVGALRLRDGWLMLVSLRHAGQVVEVEDLPVPGGRDLDKRELDMARQLMQMLAGEFDPAAWRDEYRARVEALIASKAHGKRLRLVRQPERRATEDLSRALRASLSRERKRA